jgi:hypothetical protein
MIIHDGWLAVSPDRNIQYTGLSELQYDLVEKEAYVSKKQDVVWVGGRSGHQGGGLFSWLKKAGNWIVKKAIPWVGKNAPTIANTVASLTGGEQSPTVGGYGFSSQNVVGGKRGRPKKAQLSKA